MNQESPEKIKARLWEQIARWRQQGYDQLAADLIYIYGLDPVDDEYDKREPKVIK